MNKQKVWLDTDIGNDIDDAVALAYLLKKPECDLLGITTVTGQSIERAKIADALCKIASKNIPIFPGIDEPLFAPQRQGYPPQARFLADWEHDKNFKENYAIEAMYEAIVKNPGEVTLIAIGPMTNVALLFKVHPDVRKLLKDVVLMCGEFFGKSEYLRLENEWNAFCDPYAAAIVYNMPDIAIRSIGLDVTTKVVMTAQEVKDSYTSPLLKAVYEFSEITTGQRSNITYHDPLAAVSIFKPEIMTYETGKVSVELRGERVMGRTYFDKDENGLHTAALTVDKNAFYKEYFDIANS